MLKIPLALTICTILTATLAGIPPSSKSKSTHTPGRHIAGDNVIRYGLNYSDEGENQLRNAIQLQHLSTLRTRDFFSDLIRATLDMSVKELLAKVETTFKNLDRVTNQGVEEVKKVSLLASPGIRDELSAITGDVIDQIFHIIDEFLVDLGMVLPYLQPRFSIHGSDSASDIIWLLLGKTVEELVTTIAHALNRSLELLDSTIASFRQLASKAKPEVAAGLNHIANEYLNQGRSIIIPMLDQLLQLVDINRPTTAVQHDDLLNAIVSRILGFNVKLAALEANNSLSQIIPLFESTRRKLYDALQTFYDNESYEVQAKVMNIYDKAVDDVIRRTNPIISVLLQFDERSRRDKTFVYELAGSLLGIGADSFRIYLHNSSLNVDRVMKVASTKIISTSVKAGLPVVLKITQILTQSFRAAKIMIEPLVQLLKPAMEQKNYEVRNETEDDIWSEKDGSLYNRDAIFKAASEILEFDVTEATKTLKTALEGLDQLMELGLQELGTILTTADISLGKDILMVMNETLTDIHITLQPMLDVLLPFLPDPLRHSKQIAVDIYTATNEVDLDRFTNYCSSMAKRIPEITDLATIRVNTRAARAGPRVHGQIQSLLKTTDVKTKAIIQPFLDILGPVISPR